MPQVQQNNSRPFSNQQFPNQRPVQNIQSMPQNKGNVKSNIFRNKKLVLFGGLGAGLIVILIIVLIINIFIQPAKITTPSQPATITFWTRSIDEQVIQDIISNFERENPLIKVKHETQSDTDYKNRITTRLKLQSANIGNIVDLDESWIDQVAISISPITDATILGRYSVASIKNNSINQIAMAVPFQFDGLVLAYNQDHLAEINFTEEDFNKLDWTSLASKSSTLTKTKTIKLADQPSRPFYQITRAGAAVGSPLTVTNAVQILQLLLIQNDAQIYDPLTLKFLLNSKFDEVMKFYTNFQVDNIWSNELGNDIQAFSKGNVSMILVKSADIDAIKKLNPNLHFATVIPAKIGGIKNISLSKSLVIPNYMPNYAQSVKFLEYLTRSESNLKLFNSKNSKNTFIPAQITSLNQIPKSSPFAVYSDINTTAERFISPNYDDISSLLYNFLTTIYISYGNKSGFGDKQSILTNSKDFQSQLDQYIYSLKVQ